MPLRFVARLRSCTVCIPEAYDDTFQQTVSGNLPLEIVVLLSCRLPLGFIGVGLGCGGGGEAAVALRDSSWHLRDLFILT